MPGCIVVAGQIASGKTSLAAGLSAEHGYRHIRVRQALLDILGGADWDRARFQREGADLDKRTRGRWLLEYLMEERERTSAVVVDSGRTRRQVEPILEQINDAAMIYLEASEEVRRGRYRSAARKDPLKRNISFDDAMDHATEQQARDLRAMSHLVVETDGLTAEEVLDEMVYHFS